ncbi:MAG TPA: SRPBCC family protein [Candidatus Limnocylindrales bacterium]
MHIEGEIVIGRPVEEVFDFVADECNEPRYNPQMRLAQKVSEGPIGVGTRYRAEVMSGRQVVPMDIELTGYERPTMLASTTRMAPMDVRYALTFDPIPQGTRMRWVGDVEPKGCLRLMAPVVGWLGRRQEVRIWAGLKDLLEEPGAPATDRPRAGAPLLRLHEALPAKVDHDGRGRL